VYSQGSLPCCCVNFLNQNVRVRVCVRVCVCACVRVCVHFPAAVLTFSIKMHVCVFSLLQWMLSALWCCEDFL
jgi:hypothetical protein